MTEADPKEGIERLTLAFHEAYERLAPAHGYITREDTRAFDPDSPNGRLMNAVISEVFSALIADRDRLDAGWQAANARALEIGLRLSALEGACKDVAGVVEQLEAMLRALIEVDIKLYQNSIPLSNDVPLVRKDIQTIRDAIAALTAHAQAADVERLVEALEEMRAFAREAIQAAGCGFTGWEAAERRATQALAAFRSGEGK